MKVILISKIAKLGDVGEIVNVKDGFAKNFLIPSKKAIAYTVANYKFFEEQKQHFEAENQKSTIAASKLKSSLEGKDIIIIENASDDGRLYGLPIKSMAFWVQSQFPDQAYCLKNQLKKLVFIQ